MIDWARVIELRDEIGAEDFEEVVELFLSEVEERLETLSNDKGVKELSEDFHFLKGSALNLGFDHVARLCHESEKQADAGGIVDDVAAVKNAYDASKAEFFAKLGSTLAA